MCDDSWRKDQIRGETHKWVVRTKLDLFAFLKFLKHASLLTKYAWDRNKTSQAKVINLFYTSNNLYVLLMNPRPKNVALHQWYSTHRSNLVLIFNAYLSSLTQLAIQLFAVAQSSHKRPRSRLVWSKAFKYLKEPLQKTYLNSQTSRCITTASRPTQTHLSLQQNSLSYEYSVAVMDKGKDTRALMR